MPGLFAQQPDSGDRTGVGHLEHLVDHAGHERRLAAGAPDSLDPRRHPGREVGRAGLPRAVERRVFRVHDGDLRGVPLIADVTAESGAGATGARADDDP